eukprot:6790397-Karenia_brevis.AAC.1
MSHFADIQYGHINVNTNLLRDRQLKGGVAFYHHQKCISDERIESQKLFMKSFAYLYWMHRADVCCAGA